MRLALLMGVVCPRLQRPLTVALTSFSKVGASKSKASWVESVMPSRQTFCSCFRLDVFHWDVHIQDALSVFASRRKPSE
jgi:hypothetical protein